MALRTSDVTARPAGAIKSLTLHRSQTRYQARKADVAPARHAGIFVCQQLAISIVISYFNSISNISI